MKFWKMQGCGNDFIVIDGRYDNRDDGSYSDDAFRLCSRKFSIGADGFIIVKNSEKSDIQNLFALPHATSVLSAFSMEKDRKGSNPFSFYVELPESEEKESTFEPLFA